MEKKRISLKWIALVFIFAATGAGILIGGNITASKFRAEQELNYRLNRSDLDGLGEIEGTIYVTGHKSPDSDTVGSSIAYAALLQTLGYDARPVVLGEINNETRYILETGGLETPVLLDDASGIAVQFERTGYYIKDKDSTPEKAVFNRTATLKDSYKPE